MKAFGTFQSHPEYCIWFRASQFWAFHRQEIDKVERVRQKVTNMARGLKGRIYKQRLRELGLFSHEQRCLRGILLPNRRVEKR